ncbi:hypothetical protein ACIPSJ_49460 [Streptomyces sp. NPDC090088]|uniref:hypothetical protein n=1 Tax=Streptomyces sp. NPDC090088 TaxID=3365944 RepID=UPI00381A7930
MSESTISSTELTSQYAAQVTGDLERNIKEQERISEEIRSLDTQLAALKHDHTMLVNMHQALGIPAAPVEPPAVPDTAAAPSARKETASKTASAAGRTRGAAAGPGRTTARKAAARQPKTKTAGTETPQPTLVELVRSHLAEQSEPRSAAEITTALGQAHPERGIKTTVVRTTLEGLVAKTLAQRSKQGSSVFYASPDTPQQSDQEEKQPSQAE